MRRDRRFFSHGARDAAWYGAWFVLGCALWVFFLNGGDIPFDFHDWAEVNAPRLAFVQDALRKGVFPLHMPDASALRGVTDRYFSLPDVFFMPQLFLMKWLSVGEFVLAHFLILYAAGYIGLIRLSRRLKLSPAAFAVLFLIYNGNGHLISHVAVGHVTWGGALLFSWFMLWVYELYEEGEPPRGWPLKMGGLLFVIFLQGSFHQFVWCLLFLCAAVLTFWTRRGPDWARWKAIFSAGVCSVGLSAVRILPVAIQLDGFDDDFLGGYRSLRQLVRAFLIHVAPADALDRSVTGGTLGWWEYDMYIGFALAALLLILAGTRAGELVRARRFPRILIPIVGMSFLAVGNVYALFRALPVPLFSGERVSSRFLILPFLFFTAEALRARGPEAGAEGRGAKIRTGVFALLAAIGAGELFAEARAWRVGEAVRAFPVTVTDLSIKIVANRADPVYFRALWIGAGITLLTAAAMTLSFFVDPSRNKSVRRIQSNEQA